MDLPYLLRRVVVLYLVTIGLLGFGTTTWAIGGLLRAQSVTIGRLWLAVAGFGTVLTVALIGDYYRRRAQRAGGRRDEGATTRAGPG